MARREFKKSVKVEIVRRATRIDPKTKHHVVYCEGCGVQAKTWHIDHTSPDALQVDKSKPLTAADGKLLCAGHRESCHGKKTAEQDMPAIAKSKRCEAADHGIKPAGRTGLEGRSQEEKHAARAARGTKPSLAPRAMFEDA